MRMLEVTASPRGEAASSLRLAAAFRAAWLAAGEGRVAVRRDLGCDPAPPIDAEWIAANYTDPAHRTAAMQARLQGSDTLIEELLEADRLVIAAPMYNFSVPAPLKAWIDMVTRIGRTFALDAPGTFRGLAGGEDRAALVIMTSATHWAVPPADGREDHCGSYLLAWLRFLGFTRVELVNVAYQLRAGPPKEVALAAGEATLARRAATW